jgi:hypothetical protein
MWSNYKIIDVDGFKRRRETAVATILIIDSKSYCFVNLCSRHTPYDQTRTSSQGKKSSSNIASQRSEIIDNCYTESKVP